MKETINSKYNKKVFLSLCLGTLTYLTYIFLTGELFNNISYTKIYNILILILVYSLVAYLLYYLIFNLIFKLKLNNLITYLLTLFPIITSFYFNNSQNALLYLLSLIFIFLLYGLIKSKKLNKNNFIKYILIPIILLYLIVSVYSLIFEQDKIAIDRYNFNQLEIAKTILKKIPKDAKKFYTLKKFYKIYGTSITPIKNCYYISNDNGKYPYIFGFQIESLMYKFMYFGKNYAYPKYDLSYDNFCDGGDKCIDGNLSDFNYTISNPCQD